MNSQKILAIFLCLSLCFLVKSTSIAQNNNQQQQQPPQKAKQPPTATRQLSPGIPQSKKKLILSQIQALRQQNGELIKGEQNAIEKIRIYGDFRLKNEYAKVGNTIGGLAKAAVTGGVPGFIAASLKEIGVGTLDLAADKLPSSLRDKAKAASAAISIASGDITGASLKNYEKLCDVMIDYYSSVHDTLIKQHHQNNLKIKELERQIGPRTATITESSRSLVEKFKSVPGGKIYRFTMDKFFPIPGGKYKRVTGTLIVNEQTGERTFVPEREEYPK